MHPVRRMDSGTDGLEQNRWDSMILRMKEPGEVEVLGNKKNVSTAIGKGGQNQGLSLNLSPTTQESNYSVESISPSSDGLHPKETILPEGSDVPYSKHSESTNHITSGLVKTLRKVRVKRPKEKSDDEMSIEEETVTEVESKKYTHSEAMKALEVAKIE